MINQQRAAYSYAAHVQHIAVAVAGLGGGEEVQVFALLDPAQRPTVASLLASAPIASAHARIYEGRFNGDVASLSPLLVQLPAPVGERRHIESLSRPCEDLPMLSFMATTLALEDLARSLQDLLVIETEEGRPYLLRIADTLALAAALKAATPQQRACMMGGILAWWTVDTRGRLSDLRSELPMESPSENLLPLRFSFEQMNALLDASTLPITAAQLRQTDPRFAEWPMAEQHDFVARMTSRSANSGFTADVDVLTWCTAALRCGERFDEAPLMRAVIIEATAGENPQTLSEALATLQDDAWDEIRVWADRDRRELS